MIIARRLVTLDAFDSPQTRELAAWLRPRAADNPFNPSVLQHGGRWYVAFRHFGPARKPPFEASLLDGTPGAAHPRCTSLTRHAASFGVPTVADPKLFELLDDIWITFNDGWSATKNNIFLMRITPALGRPMQCIYPRRAAVEKNWGFFHSDGALKALYSIDPVRVLLAPMPDAGASEVTFTDQDTDPHGQGKHGLTIGTQICQTGDRSYLVAHQKWYFASWRAYLGRWIQLDDLHGRPRIVVSPRWLSASYRELLGSFPKHNPHLLSCTYFSGLSVSGNTALLSYGVNDVRAGFAEVELDLL